MIGNQNKIENIVWPLKQHIYSTDLTLLPL